MSWLYDVNVFTTISMPKFTSHPIVWELVKALHDMLMQQRHLYSHQQNNEFKLGYLIATFLPSVVKKEIQSQRNSQEKYSVPQFFFMMHHKNF